MSPLLPRPRGARATSPTSPVAELVPLVRDIALALVAALLLILVLLLAGVHLRPVVPIALAVVVASGLWFVRRGISRADVPDPPELDLDPDGTRPDARDLRVRRMEASAHSAQPSRKITARALGQVLAQIAQEREHREDMPPLSEPLRRLIAESTHPDADAHPVAPIDRPTLHRYLRELAAVPARTSPQTPMSPTDPTAAPPSSEENRP